MKVLFVQSAGFSFDSYAHDLRLAGFESDVAADGREALWMLAGGDYRAVVLCLEEESHPWEVVEAALWCRPPARVIALGDVTADPALRRRAYSAGVWELAEKPRKNAGQLVPALLNAIRSAVGDEEVPSVLLVDDCVEVTEGIGSLILEEGFQVEPAQSTQEAVRKMRVRDYDLIITEVRRHGPDGFEVIRSAARLQPDVPVVVLTACRDDGVFLRAVELGAQAFLHKLDEPDEILGRIRAALRSHARGPSRR